MSSTATSGAFSIHITCATRNPTTSPTRMPTLRPHTDPTPAPTRTPTDAPSNDPTTSPSNDPTASPLVPGTTDAEHAGQADEDEVSVTYTVSVEVCEDETIETCRFDEGDIVSRVETTFDGYTTTISDVQTVDDTVIMELTIKADREIVFTESGMESDITDALTPKYPKVDVKVNADMEDEEDQGSDEISIDYVGFAKQYQLQLIVGVAIGVVVIAGCIWCLCVCGMNKKRKLREQVEEFNRVDSLGTVGTGETGSTVTRATGETIGSEADTTGFITDVEQKSKHVLVTPSSPSVQSQRVLKMQQEQMRQTQGGPDHNNVVPGAPGVPMDQDARFEPPLPPPPPLSSVFNGEDEEEDTEEDDDLYVQSGDDDNGPSPAEEIRILVQHNIIDDLYAILYIFI
eukprot:279645_1